MPPELPRFAELESEYEILRELGRGGTAVVYLARERELGRTIALKVIRATYIEDQEAAARLMREARTVGALQHPNIVMLYGTRRLRDNSLALIMQYVPGRTLKSEIRAHGALPFERVTQILDDVGGALAHAHRHRIVHRDIKPENIYLDEDTGSARLSDFGIARSWDVDSSLTLPGSAIGTPTYMSPEQIDGAVLDGRSDIYSLGLIGYEMLTGTAPWSGESLFSIIYKQKHEALPSLVERRPGIPEPLLRAIEGALGKDPADRWSSAHEFLAALSGAVVEPGREPATTAVVPASVPELAEPAEPRPPDTTWLETSDSDNVTIQYRRADAAPTPLPSLVTVAEPGRPAAQERPARRRAVVVASLLTIALAGAAAAVMISQWAGARGTDDGRATAALTDVPVVAAPVAVDSADPVVGPPAVSFALQGDMQDGIVGDTLPQPLVVRVEDDAGRPVSEAVVRFAVLGGDGLLMPDSAVTDESGAAQTLFMPHTPGLHTVEAEIAGGTDMRVTFSARVQRRTAARLAAGSTSTLRGEAGSRVPLVVRVEDDRGTPLPGVRVRFSVQTGDGRLVLPELGATGSDGLARAEWVLGSGAQEVVATVAELPDASVIFSAIASPPPLSVRRGLAVGGTHSCSLAGDGSAACWGGNDSGQLGDGSVSRRVTPARVVAPEPFVTMAAGVSHTCGIGGSGTTFCWGANTAGQIGDGTRTSRPQPARVALDQRLVILAAGNGHTCGADGSGVLYCWGQNTNGQLGDGTRADRLVPVIGGGNRAFRSVTLGWLHSCGLTVDGEALCWGSNGSGQLGDGSAIDRLLPVRVTGAHRFTALDAGSAHTCGLHSDGRVLCWGRNTNGQLGDGGAGNSLVPVAVESSQSFSALSVGGVHSCALARDGGAWCWGRNTYGQLGDGSTDERNRPVAVEGGLRFTALHASGAHTCGTTAAGQRHCWGFNVDGQLGDGTRQNRTRPVAVNR